MKQKSKSSRTAPPRKTPAWNQPEPFPLPRTARPVEQLKLNNEFMEHTAQQFRDLWERISELNADIKQVVDLVGRFAERQGLLIQEMRGQQQLSVEMLVSLTELTESLKAMSGRQNKDDDGFAGSDILN